MISRVEIIGGAIVALDAWEALRGHIPGRLFLLSNRGAASTAVAMFIDRSSPATPSPKLGEGERVNMAHYI